MDIVLLVGAIAAAMLLPRPRALVATGVLWAVCVTMVAVGPAHNAQVHVATPGFYVPWILVGILAAGLVLLITAIRRRRAERTATAQV